MVVEVEDAGGSREMEHLIIGAIGAFHIGVVDPATFADAFELHVGRVEDTFLEALQLAQASAAELLSPIGLEVDGVEETESPEPEVDELRIS